MNSKYNRWEIIDAAPSRKYRKYVLCRCDCGTVKEVILSHLKDGRSKSCGCLKKEINTEGRTGLIFKVSGTRLHRIFGAMKSRTTNPENESYTYYGARGIKICDEWNSFKSFREWSLNNGYNDTLSINRINNDLGYSPENCEWITIEDNLSEMCNRHKQLGTGGFSQKVWDGIREKNRDNLGAKFSMFLRGELIMDCEFLLEAAQYIVDFRKLDTEAKQVKKNISGCLHGKRKTCHGFTFKWRDDE